MTALIDCRALRGDDTLGFLAAVGLLELCTNGLELHGTRLGWTESHAVLEVPADGLDDLVERLAALAVQLQDEGRVLPFDHAGIVVPPASDAERKRIEKATGVKAPLDPLKRDAVETLSLAVQGGPRSREVR